MASVSLDDALSVYTFEYLPPQCRAWNAHCANTHLPQIREETFVVYPRTQPREDTLSSVRYRLPVYFGNDMINMYDARKLQSVHGYSNSDVIMPVPGCRRPQVVIAGPVWCQRAPDIKFHVVHASGVNLETTHTADFAVMIDDAGCLRVDRYKLAVQSYITSIVKAVSTIIERNVAVEWTLRMPMIGLGAYLSVVSPADCVHARQVFAACLTTAALQLHSARLQVCDYEGSTFVNQDLPGWEVCRGPMGGDLFAVEPHTGLILVNAWDDVSFIGNGGQRDNSIDGFTVAGHGPGSKLTNCSFLHNPCFVPELQNAEKWVFAD